MQDTLASLLEALKGTSSGSKAVAALVAVAVALAIAVTAIVSNEPHFEMLLSGLDDSDSAKVMKALSESSIPFRVSQPPAPFVVYVDEDDHSTALQAAYGSGALDKPLAGILADAGGMSSVFMSSGEREQMVRKREWQEMEGMLEAYSFVEQAQVRTSTLDRSPFAGAGGRHMTASVQLRIKRGQLLTSDQAATVTMLVSRGLGIDAADLFISDQLGQTIHDGMESSSSEPGLGDWLSHKERYDRTEAHKANAVLEEILGQDMARVTIDSLWSFEQTTTSSLKTEKGTIISETKNSTETPVPAEASQPGSVGTASNIADFGSVEQSSNPQAEGADAPGEPLLATTDEELKEYQPSTKSEETVQLAPELKRLSVALFLDDSVDSSLVSALEAAVKAAVGFEESRGDFMPPTVQIPFVANARDDSDPEAVGSGAPATEEEPAEPNPMMEMLLKRGVEIVSALVFIVLLLKSLRASGKPPKGAIGPGGRRAGGVSSGEEVDPELLAQAQLQELLSSDPEKVGQILSSWARDEQKAGATK